MSRPDLARGVLRPLRYWAGRARPQEFQSWRVAVEHLERTLSPDVSVLSIDVFDTVLFRRIHPDLIVTGTARELERYLRARGIEPACDVAAERGNAFDEIAAVCQARGGDCEAPLRETLQRWIERVAGRTVPDLESLVSALEQFEVDSEQRASQTNAVVVEWIARERARGRRIVFCSDMYLGSVLLFRLLQAGGCAHLFDAGYVSADVGLTKASGRLFGHVLQREGIGSERIVHVGDSLAADGHGAARAHIRAIVVRDRDRRRRSAVALSDRIAYSESTDWAGIVIAAYADPGSPASTVEESVGRTVIGPAVAAAAHSIADQCRARGVRHVYFLSREGLLLKAAFDRLRPQVWRSGGAPRASYACLSRFTTLLAATRGLGPYELSAALTNHPFATLQRLLAPLGVPPDVLERCGGRCGIAASDAPLPAWFRDWPPFLRVLDCAEVKQHVERASREAHDRLAGYLMQQNFFAGGRVAIVDVGWGGLMQENLHRAFGCQPGFPEIIGFYLGVDEYGRGRRSDARQLVGVLGESQAQGWQSGATLLFPAGLEVLLRAPHGTTIGYVATGTGAMEPRFRDDDSRPSERADEPRLAVVHHAALDYVQRYAECTRMLDIRSDQTVPFARTCLDRFMRYPTVSEARFLFSLSSVSDLGTDETRQLGDDVSRLPRLRRLRSLRRLVRSSLWPHGTAGLAAAPPLRHALVARWAASAPVRPATSVEGLMRPPVAHTPVPDSADEGPDADTPDCVERLAWERTEALASGFRSSRSYSSASSSAGVGGLDLGYTIWAPVTRRVVNLWRSTRGRPTYMSDGISHVRLLRRSCAHSKATSRILDLAIRMWAQAAHVYHLRSSSP